MSQPQALLVRFRAIDTQYASQLSYAEPMTFRRAAPLIRCRLRCAADIFCAAAAMRDAARLFRLSPPAPPAPILFM